MATFIQGVTDTNLDPVLFTPDYSFLRYTIDKKTSQYEQGLKSVSATYGALKRELSDPMNVQRRDQYLKAADSQLQQIASADLSLQQNVNAANAIFDPIATDPAIAFDAYHTQRINKQLAQMDSWAQSDDINQRKKFNKDIYNWVKRDLDSLKAGNGNISNYKVQGRSAFGYIDPQEIVVQAAKDRGMKMEVDDKGNPYIVTTSGGPSFRQNYDAFAREVLKSNPLYTQQRSILGQAKVEDEVEMRRMMNPAFTKEQALTSYVDDRYVAERNDQKQYISGLSSQLAQQVAELEAYTIANAADINAGKEAAVIAEQKKQAILGFSKDIADEQAEYNENFGTDDKQLQEKKEAFKSKFLSNPEGYFANQVLAEDVKRYSNIQSTFGTRSIKTDTGYLGMMNVVNQMRRTLGMLENNEFDNNMDALELQEKQREFDTKQVKGGLAGKRKNADGTTSAPELQYVGDSSNIITTSSKLTQLQNKIETTAALAINDLSKGLNVLEYMGNDVTDVSQIRGYVQQKLNDPTYRPNKEQQDALSKVYRNMFAWARQNNNDDMLTTMRQQVKDGMRVNQIDFADLLLKATKNYQPTDDIAAAAMGSLVEYHKKQELLTSMKGGYDKALDYVVKNIKDDKTFQPIVRTENGTPRLLNEEDVRKQFEAKDYTGKPIIADKATREKIVNAYFTGNLDMSISQPEGGFSASRSGGSMLGYTNVRFGGKEYYFPGVFSLPTSSEYKSLMKSVNEKVSVPVMDQSNEEIATASSLVQLNGPLKQTMSDILSNPTQINSNIYELNSGEMNDYKQVGTADQDVIRAALKNENYKKDIVLVPSSPLAEGSMMVKVTFAGATSKTDVNPVAGKVVYFPIDPTKGTPDQIQYLARANDNSEYMMKAKKNEPYVIDYYEGSGVKAMIYPEAPGSTKASVRLMYKYDPATGAYTDNWQVAGQPFDVDFNQNPFDEVRDEILNKFINPYMQQRVAYNKTQVVKTNPDGSAPLSTQILNELKQLKGK